MQMIGVSAIGPLHLTTATPCQDACAFEIISDGTGVIAVADGLGSAEFSDFGARHAVEAAVKAVKEMLCTPANEEQNFKEIAKKAFYSARQLLETKALEYQCKLRDLACTLILVIMHDDITITAHIGDGAVIAKTKEGLDLISAPAESEYVNEVSPLTGKDWEDAIRIGRIDTCILALMVFTDGLQRAALKKSPEATIPFDKFCNPLFSFVEGLSELEDLKEAKKDIKSLLLSKKVCDNSDDDKTLVIAILKNKAQANNG